MKAHHLLLTLGFACLLLPHGSGAAQGVLLDARVLVTLPSPGEPVHVRATFKLQPGAGAEEIPLSALSPEPANIGALRALLNEDPAEPSWEGASSPSAGGASPFSLEEVRDHFSEGSFRLAAPASGFGGPLFLHLSYTVERAWTGENRVTLPLVVSRWVPAGASPPTSTCAPATLMSTP